MTFSIERKASIKKRELRKLKEIMIRKERLHINESVEYSRFLSLYSTYGNGLAEDEFADIFLDISKTEYYDLKKRSRSRILKKEVVSDQEIESMKMKLILDFKLKKQDEKHYAELLEMYNSARSKLSFVDFAERVFDIAQQTVSRISLEDSRYAVIFSKTNSDYFDVEKRGEALENTIKQIEERQNDERELKDTIAKDRNLHVNNSIDKKEFEELYEIYGAGYTQVEFAEIILGIDSTKAKGLLSGKRKDVKIWSAENLSLDELLRIRTETIQDEKLHINEKINYARFKKIYEKHAGILSEVDFALEILDIPRTRYNELSKDKCESLVLSSIEVPEKIYAETKSNIKKNENVFRGKPVTYDEFLELYRKYGNILNELDFAEKVLEMDPEAVMALKRKDIKTSWILKGEENEKSPEDFKRLRQIVIKENKLHIGDRMTGNKFRAIYEKYGFGMSQKDFALQILDIKDYRLNVILRDEEQGTAMLTNEKVTKDELQELRKNFLNSGEHCQEDMIDYEEFSRLYDIYGGKLTENLFARKILFISEDCLRAIKGTPGKKTEIFFRAKISDAYIANLKARTIKSNLLYYKQPITLPYFNKLYRDAHTILSRPEFAGKILEVSRDAYRELQNKQNSYCIALSTSGTNENKAKFHKKQDAIIKRMLSAGSGYDEIEEHVSMPHTELMERIQQLYDTEVDKEEVARRHIYHSLSNGKEADEARVRESGVSAAEIETIRSKAEDDIAIKKLSKICEHIMDEVLDSPKHLKSLQKLVSLCKSRFEECPKEMPESVLECLQDSLEFLDRNMGNCLFFIKLCIARSDYSRARSLVSFNMLDNNLTVEEKRKLQEMRMSIRDAERKKQAVSSTRGKDKTFRGLSTEGFAH